MMVVRFDEFTEEQAEDVLEAMRPEVMTNAVHPEMTGALSEFGRSELVALGGVGASFTMVNPLTVEYLATFAGDRMAGVDATTRDALRKELVAGVRAGEGVAEMRKRVQKVMAFARNTRATMIARTEVLTAANAAIHAAHIQSGVVSQREWVATLDARVRPRHLRLHGKRASLREPFKVDGLNVMRPGAFPNRSDNINCRCTTIAVVRLDADRSDEAIGDILRAHERRLDKWEARVYRAARRAFAEQSRQLLARLSRWQ